MFINNLHTISFVPGYVLLEPFSMPNVELDVPSASARATLTIIVHSLYRDDAVLMKKRFSPGTCRREVTQLPSLLRDTPLKWRTFDWFRGRTLSASRINATRQLPYSYLASLTRKRHRLQIHRSNRYSENLLLSMKKNEKKSMQLGRLRISATVVVIYLMNHNYFPKSWIDFNDGSG